MNYMYYYIKAAVSLHGTGRTAHIRYQEFNLRSNLDTFRQVQINTTTVSKDANVDMASI